ncbi:Kiwa anti-phage protein KwaB-like domain-containing protein [Bacillus altitudinis]|uniref:Kiwa anti-phage protein KwaB-like domain-containing protein n=1 Tax=Bacillus altitudinis TaxID=293387 RepID=UPI000429711A|nr:Kiwa anti-phage protein KwaB-like domain-containing protein [Bacillus altitudinis]
MVHTLATIWNEAFKDADLNYTCSYTCRVPASNKKWFVHRTNLPDEYINKLLTLFYEKLDLQVEDFDVEQESKDYVYKFESNDLFQHKTIAQYFINSDVVNTVDPVDDNGGIVKQAEKFKIDHEENLPTSEKIDFIIHEFQSEHQKVFLFTKHGKSNITKNKLFNFTGESFNVLNKSNLYVFNEDISFILLNDKYYIFSPFQFQSIFKYWKELTKIRDEVLNDLKEKSYITNIDDFEEDYKKFYHMKSIIKIREYQEDIPTMLKKNKQELKEICESNEVNLEFDSDKCQFTIKDPKGITILNRILSNRSGHNLHKDFVTYPSFKTHKSTSKSS